MYWWNDQLGRAEGPSALSTKAESCEPDLCVRGFRSGLAMAFFSTPRASENIIVLLLLEGVGWRRWRWLTRGVWVLLDALSSRRVL